MPEPEARAGSDFVARTFLRVSSNETFVFELETVIFAGTLADNQQSPMFRSEDLSLRTMAMKT
jgi:hypothetical protein